MPDLLTVQLTPRQAHALAGVARLFSDSVTELNPDWLTHREDDMPPALLTGIVALELALTCAGVEQ